jgi:hypothetical protein
MAKMSGFDLQDLSAFAIRAPFTTHPVFGLGLAGEGRDEHAGGAFVTEVVDVTLNVNSEFG